MSALDEVNEREREEKNILFASLDTFSSVEWANQYTFGDWREIERDRKENCVWQTGLGSFPIASRFYHAIHTCCCWVFSFIRSSFIWVCAMRCRPICQISGAQKIAQNVVYKQNVQVVYFDVSILGISVFFRSKKRRTRNTLLILRPFAYIFPIRNRKWLTEASQSIKLLDVNLPTSAFWIY